MQLTRIGFLRTSLKTWNLGLEPCNSMQPGSFQLEGPTFRLRYLKTDCSKTRRPMEAWSFLNHRAMKSNTHITRHFERLEKSNENTSELFQDFKPVHKFCRLFCLCTVFISTLTYPNSSMRAICKLLHVFEAVKYMDKLWKVILLPIA